MLHVNLAVPLRLMAALVPGMIERGRGHIVNVASIAGYIGVPREAAYSASKSGLITFSNSARAELAGTGVPSPWSCRRPSTRRSSPGEGRPYRRRFPRLVEPARVAEALVGAVERGAAEVFVPRWIVLPGAPSRRSATPLRAGWRGLPGNACGEARGHSATAETAPQGRTPTLSGPRWGSPMIQSSSLTRPEVRRRRPQTNGR